MVGTPRAKVFAYFPDHKMEDYGFLSADQALEKFDRFPWLDVVFSARALDASGENCVDADLTFLIDRSHLSTQVRDDAKSFDIELAIERKERLFGLFDWPLHIELKNLSTDATREALKVFLEGTRDEWQTYFEQLRNTCAGNRARK